MRPLVSPSLTDEVKTYVTNYIDRVGTYIPSHTQPSGTLPCNGNTYNRSDYPALWAKLGPSGANVLGPGNGSTTFTTEDVRGRIARYTDDGAGVDPDASSRSAMFTGTASGDAPGSIQDDNVGYHRHIGGMKRIHDSADGEYGTISNQGTQHQTLSRFEFTPTPTPNYDLDYTSYTAAGDTRMKNWGTRLWVYYE